MVPRFHRPAKALLLRFADTSALWLSVAGARLATETAPGSDAHRLATAHAERQGWETLVYRPRWPVPRPHQRGDWLAVPKAGLQRLRRHLLSSAEIAELPAAPPLGDLFAALTAEAGSEAIWTIPGAPGTRPKLLLMSSAGIGSTRVTTRSRVEELDRIASTDPDRLVVWMVEAKGTLSVVPPAAVAEVLRKDLSAGQTRAATSPADTGNAQAAAPMSATDEAHSLPKDNDDPRP